MGCALRLSPAEIDVTLILRGTGRSTEDGPLSGGSPSSGATPHLLSPSSAVGNRNGSRPFQARGKSPHVDDRNKFPLPIRAGYEAERCSRVIPTAHRKQSSSLQDELGRP